MKPFQEVYPNGPALTKSIDGGKDLMRRCSRKLAPRSWVNGQP